MKKLACNYSIIRFLPYRETEEFVNIGLLLSCAETGYLDFRLERGKISRVTDFFVELDRDLYKSGLRAVFRDLELRRAQFKSSLGQQMELSAGFNARDTFFQLVANREGLFQYSEPRALLAECPQSKLDELFGYYVKRLFAQPKEFQERIMRKRMEDFLQKKNLLSFYKRDYRLGNETFHLNMPLVLLDAQENLPRQAIRPLHLDKEFSTQIYTHGDHVFAGLQRLAKLKSLPDSCVISVKEPRGGGVRKEAAHEIMDKLQELGARVISFEDSDRLIRETVNLIQSSQKIDLTSLRS
jgi:Protein of unknown function (DUF3037)